MKEIVRILKPCERPSISPEMVFTRTPGKGDRETTEHYDTVTHRKLPLHFMRESFPLYSILKGLTKRQCRKPFIKRQVCSLDETSVNRTGYGSFFSGSGVGDDEGTV